MWIADCRWPSAILVVTLVVAGFTFQTVHAQAGQSGWSEPQLMLDGPSTDIGTNPIVYTGPSNNTHLLFFGRPADDPEGPVALYYSRWINGAWSEPLDVLVTPDNKIPPTLTAVESSDGYLHVIWGTNEVWHTAVHLQKVADIRSWQTPTIVYGGRLPIEVVSAIDGRDNIHIVIATRARTIEHVSLDPSGRAGFPVEIHQIPESDFFPYRISFVATPEGRLLTCWAETALVGEARGIWCSTSEDLGGSWTGPELIATGHRGIRIFDLPQKNQLGRVTWGGLGVGGRELQLSDDDGRTWSSPFDLTQGTPMSGYTGQVAGMDAAGNLHILLNPGDGNYVDASTRDGAWLPNTPTGWQASDWIEMAVAEGNTLVAAYWVGGDTYTSHAVVDAPRIAPLPVAPIPEARPFAIEQPAPTDASLDRSPLPTPPSRPRFSGNTTDASSSSWPVWTAALSLVPVTVLVFVFSLSRIRRRFQ